MRNIRFAVLDCFQPSGLRGLKCASTPPCHHCHRGECGLTSHHWEAGHDRWPSCVSRADRGPAARTRAGGPSWLAKSHHNIENFKPYQSLPNHECATALICHVAPPPSTLLSISWRRSSAKGEGSGGCGWEEVGAGMQACMRTLQAREQACALCATPVSDDKLTVFRTDARKSRASQVLRRELGVPCSLSTGFPISRK